MAAWPTTTLLLYYNNTARITMIVLNNKFKQSFIFYLLTLISRTLSKYLVRNKYMIKKIIIIIN